jgi:Ribosomal protein L7/L12 C-terminal domain/Short C-terminal domain
MVDSSDMVDPGQLWAVKIVDPGRKKIPLIKAIRDEFRYGLREAKDLVEKQGVVATGLTSEDADRLIAKLEGLGATAQRVDSATAPAGTLTPSRAVQSDDHAYDKLRGRVKAAVAQNLRADERILVVIRGSSGQAIVGTATRCFVCKPGFMAGATFGSEVSSWSYRNIVGVQIHKGLLSGAVIIQAPGQIGVSASYWRDKDSDPHKAPNAIPVAGDWNAVRTAVARLRQLIDAAHTESPQSAAAPPSSLADELRKLADLHESGVLDDTEFSAAKQRLLGSS